ITETLPAGWTASNAGAGQVAGNTVEFTVTVDGDVTYDLTPPAGLCEIISLSGAIMGPDGCSGDVSGHANLRCSTSVYENAVFDDDPFAYWRLADMAGPLAENIGSGFASTRASFSGLAVLFGEDGLIFGDTDAAIGFDGIDVEIQISDSDLINTGGPYQSKSVELWFRADLVGPEPQMLYEQGGNTRGLNMFVQEVDAQQRIFMSGWNRDEEFWDPVVVSAPIQEGRIHHAVLVFDASDDEELGDFDGRITGHLDGVRFGTATGADQLYEHGDEGAIGGIHVNTRLPDLTNPSDGANFTGVIDEVALYDYPLDDPNDDGDFGDSRVAAHLLAGTNTACPALLTATRDGANVSLSWQTGSAVPSGVRVTRGGSEVAAAAPADPPAFVDSNVPPGMYAYELTFDVAGETCESLFALYDGCIADLAATQDVSGAVELTWTNRLPYTNVVVRRNDEVIATIAGDRETYTDMNPPSGFWTYSVAPENGSCGRTTSTVAVFESEYPRLVLQDGADAYWRLGEKFELTASNTGLVGAALDGTYLGNVTLGNDSLLPRSPDDTSILLDGIDGQVNIPDSGFINTGGPFEVRTIELWFLAELIDFQSRTLFEEGGATRGLHIYVQDIAEEKLLIMAGWNLGQERWGVISVSAAVKEGEVYHAVMVFVATEDDVFGNLDGRITGYLNGEEFETQLGADRLYQHTNDNAIGGLAGNTLLEDGTRGGGNFTGAIDEVAIYNLALDDPNGDGDLGDSRVFDHFQAGFEEVDLRPRLVRGDADSNGSINLTDGIVVLNFLFLGAAAPACLDAADTDDDGGARPSLTDAVIIFSWLFSGGPPPRDPSPDAPGYAAARCGIDATADMMDCAITAPQCR
ncbi:MAG: hypothetical protein O7J95_10845, partial [Planctomycetota bacterium]|nr:hypothetical protein [Planctomycetota bacterium]